jgi:hypothetical protein
MTEQHEPNTLVVIDTEPAPVVEPVSAGLTPEAKTLPESLPDQTPNSSPEESRRHAEAGRKGAHRVHQLIERGRLYEQEHGLKRGRQRLRQLLELGKIYEQEHGLRPTPRERRGRISRTQRGQLLDTLLRCLIRIAKPSMRAELLRLVEALPVEVPDQKIVAGTHPRG